MKKLLSILMMSVFITTACGAATSSSTGPTPTTPTTPDGDDSGPDTGIPDPEHVRDCGADGMADCPLPPSLEIDRDAPPHPEGDNVAPIIDYKYLWVPVNTSFEDIYWKTWVGSHDDRDTRLALTYSLNGNIPEYSSPLAGVDINIEITITDTGGLSTTETIVITTVSTANTDVDAYNLVNAISAQIESAKSWGTGWILDYDINKNELFFMTNHHVGAANPDDHFLISQGYEKSGNTLPALCGTTDYVQKYDEDSAWGHMIDLRVLKVTGVSANNTRNGCSTQTSLDLSSMEGVLQRANIMPTKWAEDYHNFGYPNIDLGPIHYSGYPVAGYDSSGNYVPGSDHGDNPTLVYKSTTMYANGSDIATGGTGHAFRDANTVNGDGFNYKNDAIRVTFEELTGGSSGGVWIDNDLNVVGVNYIQGSFADGGQYNGMVAYTSLHKFMQGFCDTVESLDLKNCYYN